jgi:hypothetical protein
MKKTDKTHRNHPHLSLTRTAAALLFAAVALLTAPLLLFPSAFGIEDNNIPAAVSLTDGNNQTTAETTDTDTDTTTGNMTTGTQVGEGNQTQQEDDGGVSQQDDPVAIIDNVKSMLNQLLSAYQSQNYEEAESIAMEAYLENYEYVEAPIAQHDQQLMEETEVMLREELRQMINDRVPVEQLQEHIASINANLDRAVSLLEQ